MTVHYVLNHSRRNAVKPRKPRQLTVPFHVDAADLLNLFIGELRVVVIDAARSAFWVQTRRASIFFCLATLSYFVRYVLFLTAVSQVFAIAAWRIIANEMTNNSAFKVNAGCEKISNAVRSDIPMRFRHSKRTVALWSPARFPLPAVAGRALAGCLVNFAPEALDVVWCKGRDCFRIRDSHDAKVAPFVLVVRASRTFPRLAGSLAL